MPRHEDTKALTRVLGPIDSDAEYLLELLDRTEKEGKAGTPVREKDAKDLAAQFQETRGRVPQIESLKGEYGEFAKQLEHIKNALERVGLEFEAAPRSNGALAFERGAWEDLRRACRQLLKEIRLFLVPLRFNEEVLAHRRVGAAIDFFKDYESELFTEVGEDLRKEVLRVLKLDKDILGWVDEEAGMIYRTSKKLSRKLVSGVLVLGLPILGFVGFLLAALVAKDLGWLWTATVANYGLCFAGFVAHIAKKLAESAGRNPLLEDFPLLLDIKAWRFAGLGVSLLVVYGLLGSQGVFTKLDTNTAILSFVAGFTVDSLAETALKQFERRVSARAETLQAALKA